MSSHCGQVSCPLCYAGRKARSTHKGHYGFRDRKKRTYWSAFMPMKKPSALLPGVNGVSPVADAVFLKAYPQVFAYLADTAWEDGSSRETATLTVFVEEGVFKACLNDRATGRSGWVSGATFTGVLKSLESGLVSDDLAWRRKPQGGSLAARRGRPGQ